MFSKRDRSVESVTQIAWNPTMPRFDLTNAERRFLSHWLYEACNPFWGPSIIWCWNNRIDWNGPPYPMAKHFMTEEIEAGRPGWFGERPPVPFEIPWVSVDHFWQRASAALALIPRLQGDHRFEPASRLVHVRGGLTRLEMEFLRAYNHEMVQAGAGYHITLAEQHGVLAHHLIPFFFALDDLYRAPVCVPVTYPWTDFPTRYEELSGRRYDFPDYALIRR
jgi:hypothetical protein